MGVLLLVYGSGASCSVLCCGVCVYCSVVPCGLVQYDVVIFSSGLVC